jgi:hypothetical protein
MSATNTAGHAIYVYTEALGQKIEGKTMPTREEALQALDKTPPDGLERSVREAVWHKGKVV